MAIATWLQKKKLITFVGTGGVGKTSLSLVAAIAGARQGLRVAAITIDPSRRLSTVLNLGQENKGSSSLKWPEFAHPIEVFYVDTEKLFSKFVSEHLPTELFEKLSQNRIYQQISQQLRETHNFASLYQMTQVLESGKFDLVILDTPPCHQVIDFFESPQRLQNFFAYQVGAESSGWVAWIKDQGLKVAEQILQSLVGADFVAEMDAFFRGVGGLRQSIHQISTNFTRALSSSDSHLSLVFSGDLDKQQEARYLQSSLASNQFKVGTLILNRAFVPGLEGLPKRAGDTLDFESRFYDHCAGQRQTALGILAKISQSGAVASQVLLPEVSQSLQSERDLRHFVDQVVPHWVEV